MGNVFVRTGSIGSSPGGSPPVQRGSPSAVTRQGSQGSIFEQITSQARELVRETTRQSSQDGLLAHMDKVSFLSSLLFFISMCVFLSCSFIVLTVFSIFFPFFLKTNLSFYFSSLMSQPSTLLSLFSCLFFSLDACLYAQLKEQAKEKISASEEANVILAPLDKVRRSEEINSLSC